MIKIRVGQSNAGAKHVTVGTTTRSIFMAARASAVGAGSRKGVAMYKKDALAQLVAYKFIVVETNSATVSVELKGEWYQFGVDCESPGAGDCQIFSFIAPKVMPDQGASTRALAMRSKVGMPNASESEFERALGGKKSCEEKLCGTPPGVPMHCC